MTQRKVCGGHKLAQSYVSIQNVFDKDKSWLMGLIEVQNLYSNVAIWVSCLNMLWII